MIRTVLLICTLMLTAPLVRAQTVAVLNGTPTSVTIQITPGAGTTMSNTAGCNLYRSLTAGGETGTTAINGTTLIACVSGPVTYVDTGCAAGTTCFYKANEQGPAGNVSALSAEVSATPPANPPPPSLSITNVAINVTGTSAVITASISDTAGVASRYTIWGNGTFLKQAACSSYPCTASWSGKAVKASRVEIDAYDANGMIVSEP